MLKYVIRKKRRLSAQHLYTAKIKRFREMNKLKKKLIASLVIKIIIINVEASYPFIKRLVLNWRLRRLSAIFSVTITYNDFKIASGFH